ncbi:MULTISPECIES: hypothetical protein [Dietzia]|uniref:hypothetical protein n=1 Tax=Dietzia sp. KRD202 TaxID=2729732 RepID=UPI0019D27E03|nr:hypothetical protein [Dietzia sp. KRD202]
MSEAAQYADRIFMVAGSDYFHSGRSSGQYFEVSKLRRMGVLDKCLFAIPPNRRDNAGETITGLCEELGFDVTPIQLLMSDTVVGFTISSTGRLVAYIDYCQDWHSYRVLVETFSKQLDGTEPTPLHGGWSETMEFDLGRELQ